MKKLIYSFFIICTIFISCSTDHNTIEEQKWFLLEIEGDTEIKVLNNKRPYIEFNFESSKIGGNASCNNFFADYSIDVENIHIGEFALTKMSCADDSKQEYRFLQALKRSETYKIIDEKLYFYEDEHPLLIFSIDK